MNRILLCLISTLLFTSCATTLHKDTYFINIQSDAADAKVEVQNSIYSLPAYVEVERSNHDLNLTLVSNSNQIPFKIKHMLSPTFKYWNLTGVFLAPYFYITDLASNRRFHYGKSLWLNTKDSTVTVLNKKDSRYSYNRKYFPRYYESYPDEKGNFGSDILLPTIRAIHRPRRDEREPKQPTNGRHN